MACGNDDPLLHSSKRFVDFLKANGTEVTFETGASNHEWNFWNTYIKKGIEWLPLENSIQGMNSGNVGL